MGALPFQSLAHLPCAASLSPRYNLCSFILFSFFLENLHSLWNLTQKRRRKSFCYYCFQSLVIVIVSCGIHYSYQLELRKSFFFFLILKIKFSCSRICHALFLLEFLPIGIRINVFWHLGTLCLFLVVSNFQLEFIEHLGSIFFHLASGYAAYLVIYC